MKWIKHDHEDDEVELNLGDIVEIEKGVFIVVTGYDPIEDEIVGVCALNLSELGLDKAKDMLLDSILDAEDDEERDIYKEILTYVQCQ